MKEYVPTSSEPPFGIPGRRSTYRFTPTQKSNVYDAIFHAKTGITRNDISSKIGLAPDRISFYLSDLRRGGYIAVKAEPGMVTATMSFKEAKLAAMLTLENTMAAKAREDARFQRDPEANRSFLKYQKIKELALRPGTGPEGDAALRMAVLELVRLVF